MFGRAALVVCIAATATAQPQPRPPAEAEFLTHEKIVELFVDGFDRGAYLDQLKADWAAADARRARIEEELRRLPTTAPQHLPKWARDWAGVYGGSYGLGGHVTYLSPTHGVVFKEWTDINLDGTLHQADIVEEIPGGLRLRFVVARPSWVEPSISDEVFFVRSNGVRLLVPRNVMSRLIDAHHQRRISAARGEYVPSGIGPAWRHSGDKPPESADAAPEVPAEFEHHLSKGPIGAVVEQTVVVVREAGKDYDRVVVALTLRAKEPNGFYRGMEFFWRRGGPRQSGTVVHVQGPLCLVRYTETTKAGAEPNVPEVGSEVSTSSRTLP